MGTVEVISKRILDTKDARIGAFVKWFWSGAREGKCCSGPGAFEEQESFYALVP